MSLGFKQEIMEKIKRISIRAIKFPTKIAKHLYGWTKHWAQTPHASLALFMIAFMESSFFPIPPDALLIPMVLAERKKWLRHALTCTLGSVLGALLGYAIGWGFFEWIGRPIVSIYRLESAIETIGRKYTENAFLTIFTAAFTPIPYKVITIAGGLFRVSLSVLILASLVGRAGRFFIVAGTLKLFGKKIEDSIERFFNLFSLLFILLLIGGFFLLKHFL